MLLPPKLFVLLCAESSLCTLETPVRFNGGPTLFFCGFSWGVWLEPIGVARLSLGGCFKGICRGGRAAFSDTGGAAAELTGRTFGDAGIASPNRGSLPPGVERPAPGMGGLNNGAGEAMSVRSGGSTERFDCATLGSYEAVVEGRIHTCLLGQPAACVR